MVAKSAQTLVSLFKRMMGESEDMRWQPNDGAVQRMIFHIGHHKTGTTSLQSFLSQNSLGLVKAGILYPWVEPQGAALFAAKALRGYDLAEDHPLNLREAHNALAFRLLSEAVPGLRVPTDHPHLPASFQMFSAINNQIKALRPDYVVLCSEVMSHFGMADEKLITRLRTAITPADETVIWCTLRRPDEHLLSWHGQQIRFGQSPERLDDPVAGLKLDWIHADYRSMIEPWQRLMPEAALILRPYQNTVQNGGSINDFRQHSGMSFPDNLIETGNMNIGFPHVLLPLLRLANVQLSPEAAEDMRDNLPKLVARFDLPPNDDIEHFGPTSRDTLVSFFAPVHDYLGQISGRDPFFPDFDDISQCRPVPVDNALRLFLDQVTGGHDNVLQTNEARQFLWDIRRTFRPGPQNTMMTAVQSAGH
ncbi:hypothetical protein [Pseudaestuariivita rosea]|uniref:hypothetical protein n=1 Tax=Pseudaestuariivita rosea TaxID=2763263 RepID=UPI001ABA4BC7|nr:hypothetical protein [Pseudaestuariivita rosea]